MSTMTIEEAQAKLSEVIDKLAPGEEVIITRNEQPVAKLVGQQRPIRKPLISIFCLSSPNIRLC
jgi:prevent-host-death family protein